MPPRRQNPPRQQAIRDIEMEELRQQIQRLQERLEAFKGPQAQHLQDEPHESEEDTDDKNPFHHLRDNESSSSIERCDVREKEEQTIARCLGGLDYDISKVVQLQQYWTLDDVIQLALRVEKQTPAKVEKEASSSCPAQPNTQKCFKCQGFGHIASNCPNRRIITIVGEEIHEVSNGEVEKEHNDETKPQLEEELIATDNGESLVYQDEVWCDVIPMDTCHLLLGRPWQFERKAIHDGHANTYSFVKDGVQIKLIPLKPKDLLEKKDEDKALIYRSTFQKLHQESRIACLLLLSKVNDATSPFPEKIQSLLEEFSDVALDKIPHGLPRTQRSKDSSMVVPTRSDF
ncbi:hypothetical protein SLEP1_g30745 [Rubroshorea leprosula]|uniref:CCHC-type domain-containing protein n=1 Tax=Rubroshorea leprosula TaxID=152421 RepID=A0AAV5K974_9ROSI|nr:hypothetical protein SLEP1_g30745 [Rubroshorea leprosula]